MKYLVIDAGGQRYSFDADRMESTLPTSGGPRTVRFYDADDNQVAEYSSPTSVGPAPDLLEGVDSTEVPPPGEAPSTDGPTEGDEIGPEGSASAGAAKKTAADKASSGS